MIQFTPALTVCDLKLGLGQDAARHRQGLADIVPRVCPLDCRDGQISTRRHREATVGLLRLIWKQKVLHKKRKQKKVWIAFPGKILYLIIWIETHQDFFFSITGGKLSVLSTIKTTNFRKELWRRDFKYKKLRNSGSPKIKRLLTIVLTLTVYIVHCEYPLCPNDCSNCFGLRCLLTLSDMAVVFEMKSVAKGGGQVIQS